MKPENNGPKEFFALKHWEIISTQTLRVIQTARSRLPISHVSTRNLAPGAFVSPCKGCLMEQNSTVIKCVYLKPDDTLSIQV